MASERKVIEMERLGVGLYLTEEGAKTLSKIIAEGCPIKFIGDGFAFISCPFHYQSNKSFTCQKCWEKWLEDFVQEG